MLMSYSCLCVRHELYSNTLLIELSSPSVNSVVYVKADLKLMNLAFNPKF